jgi:hypothetical protein
VGSAAVSKGELERRPGSRESGSAGIRESEIDLPDTDLLFGIPDAAPAAESGPPIEPRRQQEGRSPAEPDRPSSNEVYVVQQVRFKLPPPEQQQEIPKPRSKKVPIPDPEEGIRRLQEEQEEIKKQLEELPGGPPRSQKEIGNDLHVEAAPPPLISPSTGGTAEPNDQPYGDMFFRSYGTNPFVDTEDDPLSTFGLDVDTGSYTLARSYLERSTTVIHLPGGASSR